MDIKEELRKPRGIGTLVAVLGVAAGVAALARRMMRRRRPWYERLGHTVRHELPGGRRLRQLAGR